MILKALYSSYKVVHVAQLLKLRAKVGRDIPDKSSPANPVLLFFLSYISDQEGICKNNGEFDYFFVVVQQRDFGRLIISQNESITHSNEGRMSEARYSSVDPGYYYTESREVCKICFCEFLVIGLTNSSVVITEC